MNSSRRAVSMPDSCRANSSADTPIVWHAGRGQNVDAIWR